MINMGKILQIGNGPFAFLVIIIASIPFYFATLESYYIGGVFLPEVNAVTDGSVMYVAVCGFALYMGTDWLATPFMFGLRFSQLFGCLLLTCSVIFICINLYEIFNRVDRVREANTEEVVR